MSLWPWPLHHSLCDTEGTVAVTEFWKPCQFTEVETQLHFSFPLDPPQGPKGPSCIASAGSTQGQPTAPGSFRVADRRLVLQTGEAPGKENFHFPFMLLLNKCSCSSMGETESAAPINGSRMGVLKWPHSAGEHAGRSLHVVFCFYFLSPSLNRKRHPRLLASHSCSSHRWLRPPLANWFYCSYPPPPELICCHFWNTYPKSSSRLSRNTIERRTLQHKQIPQSVTLSAGSQRLKLEKAKRPKRASN